jgi:hypothetical protein
MNSNTKPMLALLGFGLTCAAPSVMADPIPRGGSRAAVVAQAQSGQAFQGALNFNGKEFRTNDPAEFRRLQQQFGARMPNLQGLTVLPNAAGGGAASSSAFQGVININGQEFRTNDPAEFQRLQQQFGGQVTNLLEGFPALPNAGAGAAAASSAFQGAINVNGQAFRTNDPAEFQRLQRQLGRPLTTP